MHAHLLVASLALFAAPDEPWTPAVQAQIAEVATRLVPPALGRQIARHKEQLRAGAIAPFAYADPPGWHALHADASSGLAARRVEQQIAKIATMLEERVPFDEVVFELGVMSHYVADVASPLATSSAHPREEAYAQDLARFAELKLARFPTVFDGYFPFDKQPFDVAAYLMAVSERANRFYPMIGDLYFPDVKGPMVSSKTFDDRSPAFGIVQISYNHAVSAVANVWLYTWREAQGDLSDTGRRADLRRIGEASATSSPQRP